MKDVNEKEGKGNSIMLEHVNSKAEGFFQHKIKACRFSYVDNLQEWFTKLNFWTWSQVRNLMQENLTTRNKKCGMCSRQFGVFFVKYYSWEGDVATQKLYRGQTRGRGEEGLLLSPPPLTFSFDLSPAFARPFRWKFLLLTNYLPKNTLPQSACYAGYNWLADIYCSFYGPVKF